MVGGKLAFRLLDTEIQWGVLYCSGRSLKAVVFKLCLAAIVYHLWREKNFCIFQQKGETHVAGSLQTGLGGSEILY